MYRGLALKRGIATIAVRKAIWPEIVIGKMAKEKPTEKEEKETKEEKATEEKETKEEKRTKEEKETEERRLEMERQRRKRRQQRRKRRQRQRTTRGDLPNLREKRTWCREVLQQMRADG